MDVIRMAAAIKRRINELVKSELIEEKNYTT
jgi:hypothetical protein